MNLQLADVSKSLEQLDGQRWDDPEWESNLVLECHRLRRVPLRELTPANLRILIWSKHRPRISGSISGSCSGRRTLARRGALSRRPSQRGASIRGDVLVSESRVA